LLFVHFYFFGKGFVLEQIEYMQKIQKKRMKYNMSFTHHNKKKKENAD